MVSSIIAVILNCGLNYIFIFGKFGVPKMGVQGAAIATVIARFVECAIITVWAHTHTHEYTFLKGIYRSFRIPKHLAKQIAIKGAPLVANEVLWSAGMATIMQCYSVRGLDVVAGFNISTTISNVFNIVFIALGSSVAIIVGQLLGAEKFEEAKSSAVKMMFFSFSCCVVIGGIMAVVAPLFPNLYNTSSEIKDLARMFITVAAVCMPLQALTHCTYFTLRSGGKTVITFIFDSFFVWAVVIPVAFCLFLGLEKVPRVGLFAH